MTPTPEQMAFAFAMVSGRQSDRIDTRRERERDLPIPALRNAARITAMVVAGVGVALLGLSYMSGNVANGGHSPAELKAFGEPSPLYEYSVQAGLMDDETPVALPTQTAAANQ